MPIVFKSSRLAEAPRRPVLPDHREHARVRARSGSVGYFPAKFRIRVLPPVHFDVAPDQERYSRSRVMEESERIRAHRPGRALRHAAHPPQRLVRLRRSPMRVLVTGLGTYWGGRVAQAARAAPRRRGRRRRSTRTSRACRSSAPSSCAPTRPTRSSPASCTRPRSTRSCTRTSSSTRREIARPRAARDQRDRHDEPARRGGRVGQPGAQGRAEELGPRVRRRTTSRSLLLPRGHAAHAARRAPTSSARCSRSRRSSATSPTTTRT